MMRLWHFLRYGCLACKWAEVEKGPIKFWQGPVGTGHLAKTCTRYVMRCDGCGAMRKYDL